MNQFFLVFLLNIVATLPLLAQTTPANWVTLEHEVCTIKHPKDWRVDESGLMGTKFFLFAPADDENDQFFENLNYISQDLGMKVSMTPREFAENTTSQLKAFMSNIRVLSAKEVKLGKTNYLRLEYTATQNGEPMHFLQFCHFEGEIMHLITFTAHVSTFDRYQKRAEQMVASFRLK